MNRRTTRQSLAEDIKRELLMDLNRSQTMPGQRQHLVDSIKKEVLLEMGYQPTMRQQQQPYVDHVFAQSIKNEVLAQIRAAQQRAVPNTGYAGSMGYPCSLDRATIDSIKQEVMAQIEAEQEAQEEIYAQSAQGAPDPTLVQAVKESVMADLNMNQPFQYSQPH